jgi:aspartyl/asparaginyl beta-hydroxylase (cupin superfamily)
LIRLPPRAQEAAVRGLAPGERGFPAEREPGPHFVLKRGHRGRYRFSFRTSLGGITGEVFVSPDSGPRANHDAEARRLVARLARSLCDALEHERAPQTR